MAMITRKRHGTLPPLAAGIENELLKPIAFNTENDKGILSHGFHPGASKSDLNSIPSLQDVGGCWESDHDFEEALSPATSSTASGPIYERPAGFEFHAHSIQVDKPKKKNKGVKIVSLGKDSGKKKEIYAKGKVKKVPIPMKNRLLPMSFWKEPNKIHPILPPISSQHHGEDDLGINVENLSIDHGEASAQENQIPKCEVFVSSKSDQLTEQLFECVNNETKFTKRKPVKPQQDKNFKPELLRRGDPFLIENILDKLPPSLTIGEYQTLQIIRLKRMSDPPVLLPTMAVKNNNSQKLAKIVEML